MSPLTELLDQAPTGRYDKVEYAYGQLDEPSREAFGRLISDPAWSAAKIAEALTKMGHQVDEYQVTYYRKKLRDGKVAL